MGDTRHIAVVDLGLSRYSCRLWLDSDG